MHDCDIVAVEAKHYRRGLFIYQIPASDSSFVGNTNGTTQKQHIKRLQKFCYFLLSMLEKTVIHLAILMKEFKVWLRALIQRQ